MKVAVLAASGKVGKLAVMESLSRNLEVVAFVRDASKVNFDSKVCVIQKDIFKLESRDLQGFDIIIDAFGEWKDLNLHARHMEHLIQILARNKAKFLVVGGAGSLYTDKSHTTMLMDKSDFPSEYIPVSKAATEALAALRNADSLHWVYVSPPLAFIPDAPKTGQYKIIGEEFEVNAKGESKSSYADYASALLDIALDSKYSKERVGVIEA